MRKIFLKENDVVEISVKISSAAFFSVQEKTTMTLLFLMFLPKQNKVQQKDNFIFIKSLLHDSL